MLALSIANVSSYKIFIFNTAQYISILKLNYTDEHLLSEKGFNF